MKLEDVEKYGLTAQGKHELMKYLEGGRLTRKEAMLSKCFECCNGYADGRVDCQVPNCPLYQYMPYAKRPLRRSTAFKKRPTRQLTHEQRVKDRGET